MPEISLLEPRVLSGVIEHFTTDVSPTLRGLSLIGAPDPDLNPVWEYDMVRGSRDRSSPNSPNSEARRIDHMKYSKLTGSYIYLRDKKMFNPTTLRWLREPGEPMGVAARNAERQVMREFLDLDNMQKRLMESFVWSMFSGTTTYTHEGGATVTIDYGIQSSHKPSASTAWGAANDDPIGDIGAWKQLTTHDAEQEIVSAYMNAATMVNFQKLPEVRAQLSDVQKGRMTTEGMIPRFQGIDWFEYDMGYVPEGGSFTPYIPNNKVIFLAPGNNPWGMKVGPSADDDAPPGHTGTFGKTWKEKDPSNRQFLLERHFIPCLFRPDQVVYATIG